MANRQIRQNPTNRNLPELDSSGGAMPFTNSRGVEKPDILSSSTPRTIDEVLKENDEILDALKQASQISPEEIGGASSDIDYNPVDDYARESYGLSPKSNDPDQKTSQKFKPTIGSSKSEESSSESKPKSGSVPSSSSEAATLGGIIKDEREQQLNAIRQRAKEVEGEKVSKYNLRGQARKKVRLFLLGSLMAVMLAVPIGVIGIIPHAIQNWIGQRTSALVQRATEKMGQRLLVSYITNRVAVEKCNDYYNTAVGSSPVVASALGKSACQPRMGERQGRVKQLFDDWKTANMEDILTENGIVIEYNADPSKDGNRDKPYSINYASLDGKPQNLRLTDDLTSLDWDQGNFLGKRTASIDISKTLNKTLREKTEWYQYLKRRNLKAGFLRSIDLPSKFFGPRKVAEALDNADAYKDLKVSNFKKQLVKHVINPGDGRTGAFIRILLEGEPGKLNQDKLISDIKEIRRSSASLSDEKVAAMVEKYAGKDLTAISLEVSKDLINKLLARAGREVSEEALKAATKAIPIIGQVMLLFAILDLLDLATDGTLQKYLSITNAQSMLEVSNLLDAVTSEEKRGFVDAESAGDLRLSLISGLSSSRIFANTVGYKSPSGKKAGGYNCKPKIDATDLDSIFEQTTNIFGSGSPTSGEQSGMANDQDTCENHRVDYDPLRSFSSLFGIAQVGLSQYTDGCAVKLGPIDTIDQIDNILPGPDCPSAQEVFHGTDNLIGRLTTAIGLDRLAAWLASFPPIKALIEKSNQYVANAFSIIITGSSLAGKELLQGGLGGESKSGARLFDAWSGGQEVMNNAFTKGVGEGGGLGGTTATAEQAAKLNEAIARERKEYLQTASVFERFFDLSQPDTLSSTALVTVFNEGGVQNLINPISNIATLFKTSSSSTYATSADQEYCSDADIYGRAVTDFGVLCYLVTDDSIESLTDDKIEQYGDPDFCESFTSAISAKNSQKESEDYFTANSSGIGRNPNLDADGSAVNTDFDPCRLICTTTDVLGTFARTDDPICGFEDLQTSGSDTGESNPGQSGAVVGDTYETECASGSQDAATSKGNGEAEGWASNKKYRIRLCSIPEFKSTGSDDSTDGLAKFNSTISASVVRMFEKAKSEGITLIAASTFRTYEKQAELYACAPGCTGGNPAAPPGTSNHQMGLAFDISKNSVPWNWMKNNSEAFGLKWYGPGDPPHFSTSGG